MYLFSCATYDVNTRQRILYANGANIANDTAGGATLFGTYPITIGAVMFAAGAQAWSLFGGLDEVRCYSRVVVPMEVQQIYMNSACVTNQLAFYYRFQSSDTNVLFDYSGNGRHAVRITGTRAVVWLPNTATTTRPSTSLPSYTCMCSSGWTGTNCTIPWENQCGQYQCRNSGTCSAIDCVNDVNDGYRTFTSASYYQYDNNGARPMNLNTDFTVCYWFQRSGNNSDPIVGQGKSMSKHTYWFAGVLDGGIPKISFWGDDFMVPNYLHTVGTW